MLWHGMALASGVQGMFQVGTGQASTGLLQAPQVRRSCDRVRFDDEMEKALYFAVGAAATAVNRTADRMWSWSMIITLLSHWLAASFFDRLHAEN